MHVDPLLPTLVMATLVIFLLGIVLRALKQPHLIENYAYQMTVVIIALGLLVSPAWIALFRRFLRTQPPAHQTGIPG